MTILPPKVRRAIGSEWLIHTATYAWLLPVWFSGSILSTRNLSGWQELLVVAAINVFALGICALEFLFLRITLWRSSEIFSGLTTPVASVIAGGVILGATKSLITVGLSAILLESAPNDLWGRVLAGSVVGIIVVVAVPLTLSELEHYRSQREDLINEIVIREVQDSRARAEPNPHALQEFVNRSLQTLASVRAEPETLPAVLDDMRENEIRPLSHEIWQREQEHIPDFTLGSLMSVGLGSPTFVVLPVVLGYAILMGPSQLAEYGLVGGLGALALQSIIIALGLNLARVLRPRGKWWGISLFAITNAVVTATIAIVTTTLFGAIPHYLPLQAALGAFQVLVTLTLITSVFDLSRRTHKAVEEDLLRLSPGLGTDELKRAQQSRDNRDLAQLLHSQVQNVFLAKSIQLTREMKSVTLNETDRGNLLEQNLLDLEAYLRGLVSPQNVPSPLSLADRANSVVESWSAVLEITFERDSQTHLAFLGLSPDVLLGLINEGISNAVRHGLASRVLITATAHPDSATIAFDDDGVGPRHGSPGLGSHLFTAIPHSSWQLTRSSLLGGARLGIQLHR
jgi:hypothetical protein